MDLRGNRSVSRQLLVTGAVVVSLLGGVSACGGDDDKSDPKPTATESTTAAPTPEPQPPGADGVTYEILNWAKFADDPAVLAWKTTNEAIGASLNQGKVLPAARAGTSKRVLRAYLPSLQESWKQEWHVRKTGKARVKSARTSSTSSRLVMCVWTPSIGFYDKNNKYVGKPENFWRKQNAKLKLSGDRWVVTSFEYDGKCPGGKPA